MPETDIDTTNKFMVSLHGDGIVMLRRPASQLSKAEALNLAAWLVALADRHDSFPALLEAVQNL